MPAVHEQADVFRADGRDEFHHVPLGAGEGETEPHPRGPGPDEFQAQADAVVLEHLGRLAKAGLVPLEVLQVRQLVAAGQDPGRHAGDAELLQEGCTLGILGEVATEFLVAAAKLDRQARRPISNALVLHRAPAIG